MTPLEVAQQRIDAWIQQGDVTQYIDLSGLGLISIPEGMLQPTLQSLWCYNNPFIIQPNLQQQQQPQPFPKRIIDTIIRDAIQKEELCPILYEPLQENGCILTSCFHIFSKEGFTEWSKKSSECPTCRQKCSVSVPV